MTSEQRMWEQARLISVAQHLLKRHHFRRIAEGDPCLPVPSATPQQIHMILTVHNYRRMTLKQLAEALGVKAPAVSLMVERLVEAGVLSREQNPEDRREVIIRLMPETEARMDAMEQHFLGSLAEILEKVGPECAEKWCEVCMRIEEVLREGEPPQGAAAP